MKTNLIILATFLLFSSPLVAAPSSLKCSLSFGDQEVRDFELKKSPHLEKLIETGFGNMFQSIGANHLRNYLESYDSPKAKAFASIKLLEIYTSKPNMENRDNLGALENAESLFKNIYQYSNSLNDTSQKKQIHSFLSASAQSLMLSSIGKTYGAMMASYPLKVYELLSPYLSLRYDLHKEFFLQLFRPVAHDIWLTQAGVQSVLTSLFKLAIELFEKNNDHESVALVKYYSSRFDYLKFGVSSEQFQSVSKLIPKQAKEISNQFDSRIEKENTLSSETKNFLKLNLKPFSAEDKALIILYQLYRTIPEQHDTTLQMKSLNIIKAKFLVTEMEKISTKERFYDRVDARYSDSVLDTEVYRATANILWQETKAASSRSEIKKLKRTVQWFMKLQSIGFNSKFNLLEQMYKDFESKNISDEISKDFMLFLIDQKSNL